MSICLALNDSFDDLAVSREVMVHAQSLESHQWVPMFGGLVLEINLNMTGCHDALMTFFQVPPLKIARCELFKCTVGLRSVVFKMFCL